MPERDRGFTWAQIPGLDVGIPRRIRIPGLESEYGDSTYLDISRWMPGADVFEVETGGQGDLGMPAWLVVGGPIVTAFEVAFNRANYFQEDIWDSDIDSAGEIAGKVTRHLWGSFAPGWAGWDIVQMHRALSGERDPQGRQYDPWLAAAYAAGVKLKPHDVAFQRRMRMFEHERTKAKLTRRMRAQQRDYQRGAISRDELRENVRDVRLKLSEARARLSEAL